MRGAAGEGATGSGAVGPGAASPEDSGPGTAGTDWRGAALRTADAVAVAYLDAVEELRTVAPLDAAALTRLRRAGRYRCVSASGREAEVDAPAAGAESGPAAAPTDRRSR